MLEFIFKEFMPGGAAIEPRLMCCRRDETRRDNPSRNPPGGPAKVDRLCCATPPSTNNSSSRLPSGADEYEFPVAARDARRLEIRRDAAVEVASRSDKLSAALEPPVIWL